MGAVENVKETADLIGKFHDIELNRRILKLEEEVLDLTREKRRAEDKVEELERALKFSREPKFKAPFYWLHGDNNPFCPGCWDSKHLAIHVTDSWDPVRYTHKECPACKHHYAVRAGV
jgi:hypothetical protein